MSILKTFIVIPSNDCFSLVENNLCCSNFLGWVVSFQVAWYSFTEKFPSLSQQLPNVNRSIAKNVTACPTPLFLLNTSSGLHRPRACCPPAVSARLWLSWCVQNPLFIVSNPLPLALLLIPTIVNYDPQHREEGCCYRYTLWFHLGLRILLSLITLLLHFSQLLVSALTIV